MAFAVHQFPAGSDNRFHLAGDPYRKQGVIIDPHDGESALAAIAATGWTVKAVVNTHGHYDHTGGNEAVCGKFGVSAFAHPLEEVPNAKPIGETFRLGTSVFKVLHTPGHRPGHICLMGEGVLFTGDTLFVGGCGNPKFGGNLDDLAATFGMLATLPDELVVYPGHDYALKNLAFCQTWDPGNPAIVEAKVRYSREAGTGFTHRTTLGDEKRWNVFLRTGIPAVRNRLRASGPLPDPATDADVFKALRKLRNEA